jgi:hypothetical protein
VPSLRRLTKNQILLGASDLLAKVQLQFGKIDSPPVPLDSILNSLKLQLEFDDISARFGISQHLGCTIVETRQIFVDQSLDPVDHPEMEGRLNYTIAHEIAHWYLHRRIVDPHLLSADDEPWLERQANWFASYLLMPRVLVLKEWKARVGYDGPLIITPDDAVLGIEMFGSRAALVTALADHYASELARLFKVSPKAMRIRLAELRLLPQ